MLKFYLYNFSPTSSAEQIVKDINMMCDKTMQYKRMEDIMLFVGVPTASLEAVCKSIEDRELVKLCSQCFCAEGVSGMPTAEQLKGIGAHAGMTGLADRRYILGEPDSFIRGGVGKLLSLGMKCLLCFGETAQMKQEGTARAVVTGQIKTGLADVTVDAAYRTGLLYRPLWEFGGETTDLGYALEMIQTVKDAAASALPTLPEPLPLLYGGTLTVPQLKELYEKQIIDGYFADAANMTPEEFIELIDAVGNV
ncbi:triosephosphate isomerase [Ruminococcaceae bacterium FB2012]|nr:triosephosphate isomerase [Ruminococcaceae bacterium FB2012]